MAMRVVVWAGSHSRLILIVIAVKIVTILFVIAVKIRNFKQEAYGSWKKTGRILRVGEMKWAQLGMIQRPPDYESGALTS